jgi:hypothetical protein
MKNPFPLISQIYTDSDVFICLLQRNLREIMTNHLGMDAAASVQHSTAERVERDKYVYAQKTE